jgi:hypothetical protein
MTSEYDPKCPIRLDAFFCEKKRIIQIWKKNEVRSGLRSQSYKMQKKKKDEHKRSHLDVFIKQIISFGLTLNKAKFLESSQETMTF